MKKLALILLCLLALPLAAQEATITAPPTPVVATKYTVEGFTVDRDCLCAKVYLDMRSTGGAILRSRYEFVIRSEADANPDPLIVDMQPTATALVAFLTALDTVRASETGAISRKMNFRIMGHLIDTGLLSGISVAP